VSEQATVTVPATVGFGTISNVGASKDSGAQSVSATAIILADGNSLQISLKANTASFTTTGTGTTYLASDVSWNAPTWVGGTGAIGALNADATTYSEVATSTPNAGALTTSTLVFTLAADAAVNQGCHLEVRERLNARDPQGEGVLVGTLPRFRRTSP
jgi:hypothetical protein